MLRTLWMTFDGRSTGSSGAHGCTTLFSLVCFYFPLVRGRDFASGEAEGDSMIFLRTWATGGENATDALFLETTTEPMVYAG